jgi:hypothetical protein
VSITTFVVLDGGVEYIGEMVLNQNNRGSSEFVKEKSQWDRRI